MLLLFVFWTAYDRIKLDRFHCTTNYIISFSLKLERFIRKNQSKNSNFHISKNLLLQDVNLDGWKLRRSVDGKRDYCYNFRNFTLKAGKKVKV